MRILHTADWHLGRSFHRESLLSAQEEFIDHLIDVVRSENIDLVVVAGDIYDRALPTVDAVGLLDDALSRLAATGATVVMISGNHDSAHRLGFAAELLQRSGVHVRTAVTQANEPIVVQDLHGPVAVYAIPYLEPAAVAGQMNSPVSHQGVFDSAMRAVSTDLAARRRTGSAKLRSLVVAHAFVVGGDASDSERDVSVGGVATVAAPTFAGIDYVAMGHLHRPQRVQMPGRHIHYSGSPIAYSFSEAEQPKSSLIVTLDARGVQQVSPIHTPVARPLAILRGEMAELLQRRDLAHHEQSWCQVTLTDEHRPQHAMQLLKKRFPHTVELRFAPAGRGTNEVTSYTQKVSGRDDVQICQSFLEHVRERPANAAETALVRQAVLAHRLEDCESAVSDPAPAVVPPRSSLATENVDASGAADSSGAAAQPVAQLPLKGA